jgi:hypothetical protein
MENGKPKQEIDLVVYQENRRKIPWETLEPYAGQQVAFSGDGTHVVAAAPTLAELHARLDAMGVSTESVGFGYVETPEELGVAPVLNGPTDRVVPSVDTQTARTLADSPIDLVVYQRNRRKIPPEALVPYQGEWVAFSGDGTCIVAIAPTYDELEDRLVELGIPGDSVGMARIPTPEDLWP